MYKNFFIIALITIGISAHAQQVKVTSLTIDALKDPLGVDGNKPLMSWQLQSDGRNVRQTAYEIRVSASNNVSGKDQRIWNSGRVASSQSVFVPYAGADLEPGRRYYWQVRVWDGAGKATGWSAPAYWETGMMHERNWKAQWIEPGYKEDSVNQPSPMFRKEFVVNKRVASARAYITAHGMYEAHINGNRVGQDYFTPGWTSYNKRLQYQVYDITNLIRQGNNAIGAVLGSGWYRGSLAWENNRNLYGRDLAVLVQLHIRYADGSTDTVISDGSWKTGTGAVRYSELYNGEIFDARLYNRGWSEPGFDESAWTAAKVKDHAKDKLIATINEPVRKQEEFAPLALITTPKGERVIDFGQNLVGWVKLKLRGKAGDTVTLSHAEVLDKAGNFYTDNLRNAKQQNSYILSGDERDFEPHFTFQGFRYVKIEGIEGDIDTSQMRAIAMYSDMDPTGELITSNELVNKLQKNIGWGQRGNFVDVPTDCPQRDERLGWTGDAQVFARTAAFNMHVRNFFHKWLADVAADQTENGAVPHVVPNVLGAQASGSAGWADAAVIIPWNMYLLYGDTAILRNQYNSMKKWVEFMQSKSRNHLWNQGFHFGDWLFYRPSDDLDGRSAVTDKYLISQCFFANSTDLLGRTARVLGNAADAEKYEALAKDIRAAFLKEYVTPSGRLVSGTQTAYTLALNFDMLPEELRNSAAERLVENIRSYDHHLTTGFLGTPYLCHVLSRYGYHDVAYKLLLQESYPSWLYPVKMGATTIWERWDGQKPDSTFQNAGMNSFNHYAYGAIGDWMYRVMAGINVDSSSPGYKKIVIRPVLGGNFSHVDARYKSYYGDITSSWRVNDRSLQFNVQVPPNTTATVFIPASSDAIITEAGKELKDITTRHERQKDGYVLVELGSGKYSFSSTIDARKPD